MGGLKELEVKEIKIKRLLKEQKNLLDQYEEMHNEIEAEKWEVKEIKKATKQEYEYIKNLIENYRENYLHAVNQMNKDHDRIIKKFETCLEVIEGKYEDK